jgi:C4-dicarboxylate transporter DctM subunit
MFFLFIGTLIDAIPSMVLFDPVIYPVSLSLGVDPVQLGIITLSISLVTPPCGLCLLISSSIGNLSLDPSFMRIGITPP